MKTVPFPKRIGKALRARRDALEISQEDFAELVNMHRTYYSEIERGLKKIRIDTLERLCLALKSSPWKILKDADE